MAQMDAGQLGLFLERTRQGVLLTSNSDGTPNGTPVWFDWDGAVVRIFADAGSKKIERIGRDPRISVLVMNELDEAPCWVRFDGVAEVDREGNAFLLAERLAARYWDLDDPDYATVVEQWRRAPDDALVTIRLRPGHIRSSAP